MSKSWVLTLLLCFAYGLMLGSIIVFNQHVFQPFIWLSVSVPFAAAITVARSYHDQVKKLQRELDAQTFH